MERGAKSRKTLTNRYDLNSLSVLFLLFFSSSSLQNKTKTSFYNTTL
jgi:hypothetical protein